MKLDSSLDLTADIKPLKSQFKQIGPLASHPSETAEKNILAVRQWF